MVSDASLQLENIQPVSVEEGNFFSLSSDQTDFPIITKEEPVGDLHLRFFVPSGKEYALPAIEIREVLECSPDRINPMPNVSPLILGMINLRGKVIWVCDLGQFLGDPQPVNTDRADIPVVAIECKGFVLGAVVDRIGVVAWLQPEKLQISPNVSSSMAKFVKGEWISSDDSQPLQLLSAEEILLSPRWVSA